MGLCRAFFSRRAANTNRVVFRISIRAPAWATNLDPMPRFTRPQRQSLLELAGATVRVGPRTGPPSRRLDTGRRCNFAADNSRRCSAVVPVNDFPTRFGREGSTCGRRLPHGVHARGERSSISLMASTTCCFNPRYRLGSDPVPTIRDREPSLSGRASDFRVRRA